MDPTQIICPKCGAINSVSSNFCQACGKQLREIPLSTSVAKQLGIYLLSFFLPPLGLMPGIKYLRVHDSKANIVGLIAIILTIISIILTFWTFSGLINSYTKLLGSQLGGGF
ncbi:MAG: hypothetical protein COX79_02900 [Candidatus Levybacteria bacterium CG_4_10_14_0_2_um_filter_36_16]|nr:MAG: hypothetical protein AUK12_01120 [Candidatus Levybacteria bacterium CG2_30_37_29]PIR79583.1 MAG: hypothetical protein COU26_00320 [Candidatus Levybacteria bacterium CG10_big_fil_rev_8_21_14_0_10_36_30]PIZ97273.1 MAG: hypothetical protein COX79_02900 [Candidatus Levybacteria bacterium CG_4_10_14_0_2_um_filter_36_16]PJA90947.1 MAG: hypothetical protein CO136_00070 [Candidatus Levybacteria bacterium CG_4_9_14_3_um_filter_36_7]